MQASLHAVTRWIGDEQGVTSIEYALIAALIAMVVLGGVTSLGASLADAYTAVAAAVTAAMDSVLGLAP